MDQTAFALDDKPGMTKEQKDAALTQQQAMLRMAIEGSNTSALPDQLKVPWVVAFLKYDPLPTIQKVHQPILILQGALDQQVTPEQATHAGKIRTGGGQ